MHLRRSRRSASDADAVAGESASPGRASASAAERRQQRIDELGRRSLDDAVNQEDLEWASNDPWVEHPKPPMSRHAFLAGLHDALQPRTYLEIGVRFGASLALSRARSIGIDPAFKISKGLECDLLLLRETSDAFFARANPVEHFGGAGVDLAFIDGMHLSEFVLRDFINVERHLQPGGVVVLDDVLPRNHLEAYRLRRTKGWAGDVHRVLEVLEEHRPDLTVLPVNTGPTGTAVIVGADPTSTVLTDRYDDIEPGLVAPDPQLVVESTLTRARAVDPNTVLASPVWDEVRALRETDAGHGDFAAAYRAMRDLPRYGDVTAS